MSQTDIRLVTFRTDWQKMGNDFAAKAKYLLEKIGLDIKGDWSKLTGVRDADGCFVDSNGLYASGSLGSGYVRRLWLDQFGSGIDLFRASSARLCVLA